MKRSKRGFTLVELIVTTTILAILIGTAIPLARNTIVRQREVALHQALREIRTAIDRYKAASDQGLVPVKLGTEGYPEKLDILVEGVAMTGAVDKKLKFLRRVPEDPMTQTTEWGMRSYQDDPTSQAWGGQNVFDVYTKSNGIALDGTKYKDW